MKEESPQDTGARRAFSRAAWLWVACGLGLAAFATLRADLYRDEFVRLGVKLPHATRAALALSPSLQAPWAGSTSVIGVLGLSLVPAWLGLGAVASRRAYGLAAVTTFLAAGFLEVVPWLPYSNFHYGFSDTQPLAIATRQRLTGAGLLGFGLPLLLSLAVLGGSWIRFAWGWVRGPREAEPWRECGGAAFSASLPVLGVWTVLLWLGLELPAPEGMLVSGPVALLTTLFACATLLILALRGALLSARDEI